MSTTTTTSSEEAPPYTPAPEFVIPQTKYTFVEFPAIVKNDAKAMEMLGGMQTLEQVVFGAHKLLPLRFRPEDATSHATYGDKRESSHLLIKVRKSKKTGQVSYEILGNVVNTIRFQSLADFQFVLPKDKTSELPLDVRLDDAINMFGQKLNMPPPFFTRLDKPMPYKFKQNPLSTEVQVADELGKTVTKRKLKRSYYDKQPEMASIEFAATSVPMHALTKSTDPPNEKFLEALRMKFEDRPIWSKRALLAQFDTATKTLMRNSLPFVSYTFSNGPWRLLYIRLGFDPRTRQNRHASTKYQIIDFRFPRKYDDMFKRKTGKGLEQRHMPHRAYETNANDDEDKTYIFDSLPKQKQSTYQLCDVPQVQSILDATTLTRTCDIKRGWLTKEAMQEIRDEMKSKLEEWIKDAPEQNQQAQQNDSDASKSSDDEDADFPLDQAAQIFDL